MGPVLFLLIFVAVVVFLSMRGRAKRTAEQVQKRSVLDALAPVVTGSVSTDGVLTGRYKEYSVTAETGRSSQVGQASGLPGAGVDCLRLHLSHPSLMTGSAWEFRNIKDEMDGDGKWRFLEPGQEFPFGRALGRMAGVPMPDPELEQRLRADGIEAALNRLGPSSVGWLPEVAFAGAMGRNLLERYERAGRPVPPEAEKEMASVVGLRVEIERPHYDDPSPDRFRQLLDAAIGIIEVNRQANP